MRTMFALLACFAAAFLAAAEPPEKEASRDAKRFLFIVDRSAAMKPLENAVREVLFDFICTGLRGQMTNGDTYGIWLANEQNDTSFAMESWKQRYNVEMGARATVHVKEHGFKGKAQLEVALADALRVVKRVGDLTIVLISNGEAPIGGTPFDAEINARFSELAPVMKKAKATLNTALVAQDGEIVAWAANTPENLIDVPYVAPKPKPARKESAAAPTNTPVAVSNAVALSANTQPPRPRAAVNPIIITKETVAQERRAFLAMTTTGTTNEPAPVPAPVATNAPVAQLPAVPTNAAPAVATNVMAPKPVVAAASAPELPSNAVATVAIPVAIPVVTNRVETNPAAVIRQAEPTNEIATAVVTPAAAVKISAPQPAPASGSIHPALWVAMGAGAASLGVLVTILLFRSRRHEPSLISQAIARERMGSIGS